MNKKHTKKIRKEKKLKTFSSAVSQGGFKRGVGEVRGLEVRVCVGKEGGNESQEAEGQKRGTLVTVGEGQKWWLMTPLANAVRALEC